MTKIVIDARELRTTSGRYVERMLHYLQQIDHEHDYVVLLKPKDLDGWEPTAPNFSKLACPYKEFTFGEQLGYLQLIRSLKADLVHFPFVQQPVLYQGRVVTTIQDLTALRFTNPATNPIVFKVKQKVYAGVIKTAARKSKRLITISHFVEQDILNFTSAKADKITVTYESADKIPDAPEPYVEAEGKQYIMYVGRPTPHKNLWRLIEAFQKLRATHPDLHLVLVGPHDANYAAIAQRVEDEQITNIIFTGFVPDAQLRWLYEHTAAYIFPSLSEGFGLPGLEAMHYNVPVVSSNATCLPEIYGDSVLYFDPLNIDDMASKIGQVLDDPALAKSLVAKGTAQLKKYSWKRMAEQTLAVYNQALED